MRHRQSLQHLLVLSVILLLQAGLLSAEPAATPPAAIDPRSEVAPAVKYCVDDDNAGKQDGTVLHPFKTLQQAIDAAKNNDVIAVAAGTYAENIKVQDKTVLLYGGYLGGTGADYAAGKSGDFKERNPAKNLTQLKGDGKDSVVTLYESGASVVDGFTITGGGRSKIPVPQWVGGGFYIYAGSPTISNNVIENNQTCPPVPQGEEKLGGGIYSAGANLTITDNVIRNNVSGRGAGIFADGKKIVIRGNTVENNIGVSDHGGGIFLFSQDAEISHNRIVGNEIGRKLGYGWGGGIIVVSKGGKYKLSHNVYTGNFAPSVGSAFFVDEGGSATMDHELIYANACNPAGDGAVPAVYVDGGEGGGSTLVMNHCTIVDHPCMPTISGNAIKVTDRSKLTVKNSILWNNGGDDIDADATSKATVMYTISNETLKGTGNLSKDPLFANPAGHDYRLRSTAGRWDPAANDKQGGWVIDKEQSPAIDAAEPAAPFELEPIMNGGRANLGADGNTAQASKSAQ